MLINHVENLYHHLDCFIFLCWRLHPYFMSCTVWHLAKKIARFALTPTQKAKKPYNHLSRLYAKLDIDARQIEIDGDSNTWDDNDYYFIKYMLPEYWLGLCLLILMVGGSVLSKPTSGLTKLF